MKKSKVIIPAMALLLFSTAASVTGTVAWFTSTRTFESKAGNFQVGQLDGNLACDVTAGIATTKNGDNDISFAANSILADASYNHTNDHLYTDIAGAANSYQDLGAWASTAAGSQWKHGEVGTVTYYYAATWTLTFHYTFVAEQTNINLFFNITDATASITKSGSTSYSEGDTQPDANTAQGFRIAFVSGTTIGTPGDGVVWAPYQTQTNAPAIRYVASTSGLGTYAAVGATGDLLDATSSSIEALQNGAGKGQAPGTKPATTATNYLGTFVKPAANAEQTVDLPIRITAWFEGTDPSIVTNPSTVMQALKVTMPFYVRDAAA